MGAEWLQLNKEQKLIFENFKNSLFKHIKQREVLITFRGDKKSILKQIIYNSTDKYYDYDFYSKIFNIGGKAKLYTTGGNHLTIDEIDNISEQIFINIFNDLNIIFTTETKNCKIQEFKKNNNHIFEFFSNNINLDGFILLLKNLKNKELLLIRDYYLYLVHVFGKTKIYYDTPLISTSYSFDMAKYFGTNANTYNDCIIYIYLISKPFSDIGIDENILSIFKKYDCFKDFPLINNTVYPEQNEFSVFGALFPNNIIGIYDLKKNKTIINSHLFLNNNKSNPTLCAKDGFDIPIHYFVNSFKDSTYIKGVHKIGRTFQDIYR